MSVDAVKMRALALAVRALRRTLVAALPTWSPEALAIVLFREIVARHASEVGLEVGPAAFPWLAGGPVLDHDRSAEPTATHLVRAALDAIGEPSLWAEAETLGWAYQFWSDERRSEIDARIGARGKVAATELAEKTQLFTERYMVDFLLQNSLGRVARAIIEQQRAARSPSTDDAAPLPTWPFFVEQAAPRRVDPQLPTCLRELRVLDPACGSGHFLAGAFDLLVPLYRAEAAASGQDVSDAAIAESILANNLHGLDIDTRAVRVAATVLVLKARRLAGPLPLQIPRLALLGTAFDETSWADGTPRREALAERFPGPSGRAVVGRALERLSERAIRGTLLRFGEGPGTEPFVPGVDEAMRAVLAATGDDDLGVRPDDERPADHPEERPYRTEHDELLRRLLGDGRYDVIAANPPYLSTAKMALPAATIARLFGDEPDLFAAFATRARELCKPAGFVAFVAPSNWMFLKTFAAVRARLLRGELVLVVDLGKGAFRHASKLIQTSLVIVTPGRAGEQTDGSPLAVGAQIGSRLGSDERQSGRVAHALLDKSVYYTFRLEEKIASGAAPLLLGSTAPLSAAAPLGPSIDEAASGAAGIATGDNLRFLRAVWEISLAEARAAAAGEGSGAFLPYVKGADGETFFEPFRWVVRAPHRSLELRLDGPRIDPPKRDELGVAYTTIGHRFAARLHLVPSVRDVAGASFYPRTGVSPAELLCALNRSVVRAHAHALNPSINFQLGDVRRLPFERHPHAETIVAWLRARFDERCRTQETSLSFTGPGPHAWEATKTWAQTALDAPFDAPLAPPPTDEAAWVPARAEDHLTYALGIVLGRFRPRAKTASARDGKDARSSDEAVVHADENEGRGLPWLLIDEDGHDDLEKPAAKPLREAWARWGAATSASDLRGWLVRALFDDHLVTHADRPVYVPLASKQRRLVVLLWAPRASAKTLARLARHLGARVAAEESAIAALRQARPTLPKDAQAPGAREIARRTRALGDRQRFGEALAELLRRGPVPSEAPRPLELYPEDGVRVLAASLWPLVLPMWKEPRADWLRLARGEGAKHLDWTRIAARYFPTRIGARCRETPSLAYAHGRLWADHPALAAKWETKLTIETGQPLTLNEPAADEARRQWHADAKARARRRSERRTRA